MASAVEGWVAALEGRVLAGKYRLRRLVAAGGMGAVFAADHLALARLVAIKLLLPGRTLDDQALARFQLEARAAARVAGDGVVHLLDFDHDPELGPFHVMELLQGESLRDHLRRGRMDPGATVAVFRDLLATLGRVHAAGVVHRDLKPGNLFLEAPPGGRPRVRVLDFGVARMPDPSGVLGGLTLPGVVLGTVGYMAPEQLTGHAVDQRADLFAVGLLLYTCLTGVAPFAEAESAAVYDAVRAGRVPSLRAARPGLPEGLYTAFEWATARDPAARPPDAAALAAVLPAAPAGAAWQPGPPSDHRALRADPNAATIDPVVHARSRSSAAHPVSRPRRFADATTRAVVVGVVVGGVLVTGALLALNRFSSTPEPERVASVEPPLAEVPVAPVREVPVPVPVPVPAPPAVDVVVEVPDAVLEQARADLAAGTRALSAGALDDAEATFERARLALMEPGPAPGSARADTLGRAYLALGDTSAARMPSLAAGVSDSSRCTTRIMPPYWSALARYNVVMQGRFGELAQCSEVHTGVMYERMTALCGTANWIDMAVYYFQMSDRPGPCAADAAAGLARAQRAQRAQPPR